ncbi:MAG: hypothetical protein IPP77_05525 [Bacteroidetes bacterium]|nr:hypothetical protein [Bacteroidota bacterium]
MIVVSTKGVDPTGQGTDATSLYIKVRNFVVSHRKIENDHLYYGALSPRQG